MRRLVPRGGLDQTCDAWRGSDSGLMDTRSNRAGAASRNVAALLAALTLGLGAVGYTFTRSPDAADLSMASMTSWRRTASAKSGTVWVPLSMSAANAA
jgi:hypothetical protein